MHTSTCTVRIPQTTADRLQGDSRPSDLVYPAMTVLAMLLLLYSLWVF